MAGTPGTFRFPEVSATPSAPPAGYALIYIKTDNVLYLQDSTGTETALGSASAITQLTGDVTATGPGVSAATVVTVGGASAANIAAAVAAYLTATSVNTPNTLVMRDSSGNFFANFITAALHGNADTATTSISFSGSLSGDVTGIQGATVVATVGGSSAANIHSAELAANAATPSNTASTLVERDASGNFAAGTITANLIGNVTGNVSGSSASFTGSLSGDVTGTQGATSIAANIVTGKLLTGYSTGTATPITASNSILTAFENLQAQVSTTSGAAVTSLTGDVTATGPGAATATVNSVGGQTAAAIATATTTVAAATSANTPSTLVERDALGNFSAHTVTANLTGNASGSAASFTGSLSGDVTGTQSATAISSTVVTGKLLTGYTPGTNTTINATNSILIALQNLQAQSSSVSGSALTALTGDVTATGPGSATSTVNSVGGSSAANIHLAELAANAATPANTASAIVERDASGNFSANIITAALSGNATTATNATTAVNFTGSLSGDVTGTQSTTAIASSVVTGKLLTGYATGTNTPITASNSILTALENLQAQSSASSGSAITALTGDVTATGPGAAAATLATVNTNTGSFGSSTSIPNFTVNGKGLITAAGSNVVIAPAGTLTGTTLASNVVTSSLTSVGTITSGVWNGSALTAPYMLPLATNDIYVGNGSNQPVAVSMSGDITIVSSGATTVSKIQGTTVSGTTGTVNVVFSASPTLTGILTAGSATFSGTVAITDSSTTALEVGTNTLVVDTVNGAIGINTTPASTAVIDIVNNSGSTKTVQLTGYGSNVGLRGRYANGTFSSPTAAINGNILEFISGRGWQGTSGFASGSTGAINIVAGETFTTASNATYLQFEVTPTGSVTIAEAMRLNSTGNLLINTTTDNGTDKLQVNGSESIVGNAKLATAVASIVTLGAVSSTAVHQINGGQSGTTNTITSSTYTIDATTTDYIVYTDSTSNTITITLPTPTNGRTLVIEDKTGKAGTNFVTVDPHASEKINGLSSFIISQNYGSIRLTSDGTNWSITSAVANVTSQVLPVVAIASTVIDWSLGNLYTKTLSANTTFTFTNASPGQTLVIRLTNTASNYTVTWPTIKWPVQTTPIMTTGAFSDVYTIIYDGTTYFGGYLQNF